MQGGHTVLGLEGHRYCGHDPEARTLRVPFPAPRQYGPRQRRCLAPLQEARKSRGSPTRRQYLVANSISIRHNRSHSLTCRIVGGTEPQARSVLLAGVMRSDEDVKFAPLPGDCFVSSGHTLPDLPRHRRVPARQGQQGPRPSTTPGCISRCAASPASSQTSHLRYGLRPTWDDLSVGAGCLRSRNVAGPWRHAHVARYGRNPRYAAGCGWPPRSAHSAKLAI